MLPPPLRVTPLCSLPPCGGGLGWGVMCKEVITPPHPNPPPQGGRELGNDMLDTSPRQPSPTRGEGTKRSPTIHNAIREVIMDQILTGVLSPPDSGREGVRRRCRSSNHTCIRLVSIRLVIARSQFRSIRLDAIDVLSKIILSHFV
jgi:hypothetical protein